MACLLSSAPHCRFGLAGSPCHCASSSRNCELSTRVALPGGLQSHGNRGEEARGRGRPSTAHPIVISHAEQGASLRAPGEPPGHEGWETLGNISSLELCSPPRPPLKYCQFLLQTTFPTSADSGPCRGFPTCHLGRGLHQQYTSLVLIVRVCVGPGKRLLFSTSPLAAQFPAEGGVQTRPVDRRRQAGPSPRAQAFRCASGSLTLGGWAAEAGLGLPGLPAAPAGDCLEGSLGDGGFRRGRAFEGTRGARV